MSDINHNLTRDEIVCPYCGFVHDQDIWEWRDLATAECYECDETFNLEIEDTVFYYTTSKLSPPKQETNDE